jgi:hypothetical protein
MSTTMATEVVAISRRTVVLGMLFGSWMRRSRKVRGCMHPSCNLRVGLPNSLEYIQMVRSVMVKEIKVPLVVRRRWNASSRGPPCTCRESTLTWLEHTVCPRPLSTKLAGSSYGICTCTRPKSMVPFSFKSATGPTLFASQGLFQADSRLKYGRIIVETGMSQTCSL